MRGRSSLYLELRCSDCRVDWVQHQYDDAIVCARWVPVVPDRLVKTDAELEWKSFRSLSYALCEEVNFRKCAANQFVELWG